MGSSNRPDSVRVPEVNGQTQVFAVFGYPVEHSLSPTIHNASIAFLGLNYIYIPFSVKPDHLDSAIRIINPLGIRGINLTVPHKERAISCLDWISPEAKAVGAVNTIHPVDGELKGYNTDGEGFLRSLNDTGLSFKGSHVLVLGAGGASRSVVYRLVKEGARVTIANRTVERAEELALRISRILDSDKIDCVRFQDVGKITEMMEAAELVVNTTTLGMHPDMDSMPPIPPESFHSGMLAYDLIYNPYETRFLRCAREAGAKTLNGLEMLIQQGAVAFQIWTQREPSVEAMREAAKRKMGVP